MTTKVIASTSGIVIATTSPGRQSSRSGLKCRPSATKLTASTIRIASISVPTNSLTEPDTTFAWFWNWCSSRPTGRSARIAADGLLQRLAELDDVAAAWPSRCRGRSPPCRWLRTLTCGGSIVARRISAMSPSLKVEPPARIGKRRRSSSEVNWPATRTWIESVGAVIVPPDSTAFCWPSWLSTWFKSRPSGASRAAARSRRRPSRPGRRRSPTLLTSLTLSRRWRTWSAWSLSSA